MDLALVRARERERNLRRNGWHVAACAAADAGLDISEYSARSIKKSVVGVGAASKNQVQKMVVQLLKLKDIPSEDAADGLAVAICHGYSRRGIKLLAKSESGRFSRGRYL